jgi:hypothetical protein
MRHPNEKVFRRLFALLIALEVLSTINQDVGSIFDHIDDKQWLQDRIKKVQKTYREFNFPFEFTATQQQKIEKHRCKKAFDLLEDFPNLLARGWFDNEEWKTFYYLFWLDTLANC